MPLCYPGYALKQTYYPVVEGVLWSKTLSTKKKKTTYLADPPDVLGAVLVGEAEVFVEAEAHVVAVKAVGGEPEV